MDRSKCARGVRPWALMLATFDPSRSTVVEGGRKCLNTERTLRPFPAVA